MSIAWRIGTTLRFASRVRLDEGLEALEWCLAHNMEVNKGSTMQDDPYVDSHCTRVRSLSSDLECIASCVSGFALHERCAAGIRHTWKES